MREREIQPDTTTDDRLILNILHNMDGHQLRLLEEQGHKQHNLLIDNKSNRNLAQVMLEEVDAQLATWIIYDNKFVQLEGLERKVMTSVLALWWGLKVIYTLRDEVWVRQLGYAQYLEAVCEWRVGMTGDRFDWLIVCIITKMSKRI